MIIDIELRADGYCYPTLSLLLTLGQAWIRDGEWVDRGYLTGALEGIINVPI